MKLRPEGSYFSSTKVKESNKMAQGSRAPLMPSVGPRVLQRLAGDQSILVPVVPLSAGAGETTLAPHRSKTPKHTGGFSPVMHPYPAREAHFAGTGLSHLDEVSRWEINFCKTLTSARFQKVASAIRPRVWDIEFLYMHIYYVCSSTKVYFLQYSFPGLPRPLCEGSQKWRVLRSDAEAPNEVISLKTFSVPSQRLPFTKSIPDIMVASLPSTSTSTTLSSPTISITICPVVSFPTISIPLASPSPFLRSFKTFSLSPHLITSSPSSLSRLLPIYSHSSSPIPLALSSTNTYLCLSVGASGHGMPRIFSAYLMYILLLISLYVFFYSHRLHTFDIFISCAPEIDGV